MKARIKATGEIVEVHTCDDADFVDGKGKYYLEHELFFGSLDEHYDDPYWTRLEHQAAIAAMQGTLANNDLLMQLLKRAKSGSRITHVAVEFANACAHIFVEKLKEKEEIK